MSILTHAIQTGAFHKNDKSNLQCLCGKSTVTNYKKILRTPDIFFQNISIAAPNVLDESDLLWGMEDGLIYGLVFDNVTINGYIVNEYVLN